MGGIHWNANKWLVHWIIIILRIFIATKCLARAGLSLDAVHTSLMRKSWTMERTLRKFDPSPIDASLKQGVLRRQRMKDFIQLLNVAELSKSERLIFFLCVVLRVRVLVSECVSINYHFVLVERISSTKKKKKKKKKKIPCVETPA